MSEAKKLAWIALGYVLAIVGGVFVVAIHALFVAADGAQNAGGMAAFGDMILFVLVAGFFSLAPTLLLLKLGAEKAPRALLVALCLIAASGPPSWLAITYLSDTRVPNLPDAVEQLFGMLVPFGAMLRIVAGPVLLAVEGVAFLLAKGRVARALLAVAMLMDLIPLGIFALHLAGAMLR